MYLQFLGSSSGGLPAGLLSTLQRQKAFTSCHNKGCKQASGDASTGTCPATTDHHTKQRTHQPHVLQPLHFLSKALVMSVVLSCALFEFAVLKHILALSIVFPGAGEVEFAERIYSSAKVCKIRAASCQS